MRRNNKLIIKNKNILKHSRSFMVASQYSSHSPSRRSQFIRNWFKNLPRMYQSPGLLPHIVYDNSQCKATITVRGYYVLKNRKTITYDETGYGINECYINIGDQHAVRGPKLKNLSKFKNSTFILFCMYFGFFEFNNSFGDKFNAI